MKKKVIISIIILLIIVILGGVWFISRDKTEEIINDQKIVEGNLQEKISENKEEIKETLLNKSINVACMDSAYGDNLISYSDSKDTKFYEEIYLGCCSLRK